MTTKIDPETCVRCGIREPLPEGDEVPVGHFWIFDDDRGDPTTLSALAEQGIKLLDPKVVVGEGPWRSIWKAVDRDGNSHGHYARTVSAFSGQ